MSTQDVSVITGSDGMLKRPGNTLSKVAGRIKRDACVLDMKMRTFPSQIDEGAATAEYAVVLVAATGFGAVLIGVLKSGTVKNLLMDIVKKALGMA